MRSVFVALGAIKKRPQSIVTAGADARCGSPSNYRCYPRNNRCCPGTCRQARSPPKLFSCAPPFCVARHSQNHTAERITLARELRDGCRMVGGDLTMMFVAAFSCAFVGWVAMYLSAHSGSLRRGDSGHISGGAAQEPAEKALNVCRLLSPPPRPI